MEYGVKMAMELVMFGVLVAVCTFGHPRTAPTAAQRVFEPTTVLAVEPGHRVQSDERKASDDDNWFESDGSTGNDGGRSTRSNTDHETTGGQNTAARSQRRTITDRIKQFVTVIATGLSGGTAGSGTDYYEAIIAWMVLTFGLLTVALGVVGVVVNPAILILAAVFGLTTGLIYYHLSGQMAASVYRRVERQAAAGTREQTTADTRHRARSGNARDSPSNQDGPSISEQEAYDVLGIYMDADQEEIKDAYRERVKEAHPDTDEGSKEEFKRVKEAYELIQK